jgi:3-hydroxybutyryl-CoA dehydrogenase
MSELKRIAVIGAGTMGHGIAQTAAQSGLMAVLHDRDPEALERGMAGIRNGLDRLTVKGKLAADEAQEILARVRAETDIAAAVRGAQIVVEAVPENLELKQTVFRGLEPHAAADTILATNTSSLPVGRIAEAVSTPHRVVGMHFFNPVPVMPLLEIVQAARTSHETVERVVGAGIRLGKECIVVRDSPGFATSRLGVALGLEAIRMLEAGVASAEDIDKAMTLGYRHPMGPLRLTDLIGLDVRLDIARHLRKALDSEVFAPPPLLERLVGEGKLGKKTGQGFYAWTAST